MKSVVFRMADDGTVTTDVHEGPGCYAVAYRACKAERKADPNALVAIAGDMEAVGEMARSFLRGLGGKP